MMIVAHPDDESLWGGDALGTETGWLVICLTGGSNKVRSRRFNDAMDIFGVEREIFDFPDLGMKVFPDPVEAEIINKVADRVNRSGVVKVVTHNPDGEYGHIAHKELSRIIAKALTDREKLHYFSFSNTGKELLSPLKQKAFDIYFEGFAGDKPMNFDQILTTLKNEGISAVGRKLKKVLRRARPIAQSDIDHTQLSRHEHIVHYRDYQADDELLRRIYKDQLQPRNATEVYLRDQVLYEEYRDRKYIVTDFLPKCVGRTLSVGCHYFNVFDAYCLPNPDQYETIDLIEKYRVYGSPFKHTTIDFLKYDPGYKFENMLLFGVMGIPFLSEGDPDTYTLYDKDDELVRHMDELLNVGGRVLFGPDIAIDKSKSMEQKVEYWGSFFAKNEVLKARYKLVEQFRTRLNYLIVCQKIA